jgi:hypothetical protein
VSNPDVGIGEEKFELVLLLGTLRELEKELISLREREDLEFRTWLLFLDI